MKIRNFADVKVHIRTEDILKANVVYKLTFPSGKLYIGMTRQLLKDRIYQHCNVAFREKGEAFNSHKNRAVRKYLEFTVDIIYEGDDLENQEIAFIEQFDTFKNGYNSTLGGEGNVGNVASEETRKKMSDAGKQRYIDNPELREIGKKYGGRNRKAICQYTKCGKFIAEFESAQQASDILGFPRGSISRVCRGERNHTGGFVFKFKNN